MSKVKYNLSGKLAELKKTSRAHFLVGSSVKVVSTILKLSETIVQEWHDEFVIELLQGSAGKRVFMRELLLKNAPTMVMTLVNLAKQQGDEKLSYSAASAVLSFSSRFFGEDARVLQAESKALKITEEDKMMRRTLFDFVDPDVDGANSASQGMEETKGGIFGDAYDDEIDAAFALLEEKKEVQAFQPRPPNSGTVTQTDLKKYHEHYDRESHTSSVDLFEGLSETDLL